MIHYPHDERAVMKNVGPHAKVDGSGRSPSDDLGDQHRG